MPTEPKKPTAAELSARVAELESQLAKKDEKLAEMEQAFNDRRQALQTLNANRSDPENARPHPDVAKDILARKRSNMTEEEEAIYEKNTDPVTGIPPLDVEIDGDTVVIKW